VTQRPRDGDPPLDRATLAAHGVRAPAPEALPDGLRGAPGAEPFQPAAVYDFPSIEASDGPLGGAGGYVYARYGTPNPRSLELSVAALEGAEDALATSSGTSAVVGALLAVAGAGDAVAVQADAYGGTLALLDQDLARLGLRTVRVDAMDLAACDAALAAGVKALLVETLSNPLLREADLAALGQLSRARAVPLLVDNTFATPILRRPVESGAALVLHSATKFLGGHHDLCAGVVAGRADLVATARGIAKRLGFTASPFDAWLCCRGMKTLGVRVERGQETAARLAAWLRAQPHVRAVHHPGWGALVSFDVGSLDAASRLVRALTLIPLAPSLGGATSNLSHAATSSHRGTPPDDRRALGIGDGLLRLSCGVEAAADLERDLARGLAPV
jgi:cystathionine gamma-synthase